MHYYYLFTAENTRNPPPLKYSMPGMTKLEGPLFSEGIIALIPQHTQINTWGEGCAVPTNQMFPLRKISS